MVAAAVPVPGAGEPVEPAPGAPGVRAGAGPGDQQALDPELVDGALHGLLGHPVLVARAGMDGSRSPGRPLAGPQALPQRGRDLAVGHLGQPRVHAHIPQPSFLGRATGCDAPHRTGRHPTRRNRDRICPVGRRAAVLRFAAWTSPSRRSWPMSATTSAARCCRKPSGWRPRASTCSSSTSATRPRSASRHPPRCCRTSSSTCRRPTGTATPRACCRPAARSCSTTRTRASHGVDIEDVWLGNGVSELIVMSLQALLNNGDEVLVPTPDYPLWTAAVSAVRRQRRALPVRRERRLAARPGRHRVEDHAPDQGDRGHQPEQPDRRRVRRDRRWSRSSSWPAGTT